MTSVESAVPVKTPEPDQYWEHVKSKDRVYFIGRNPEGEMVWQCDGDTVEVGNLDWSDWQHIPDCTGWDWEFEAFPHYYVGTKWCDGTAYVVRESETKSYAVGSSGNKFKYDWDGAAKRFVAIGTLVRITEAEAMARLDKPAEQWPKYYATVTDSRHYYRCDSADEVWAVTENGEERQGSPACALLDTAIWKEVTEDEAKAIVNPAGEWPKYVVNPDESCRWYIKLISENSAQYVSSTGIESPERWGVLQTSLVKDGQWVEVTEAEAFARVVKPTEPDSDPPPFSKPFTNARSCMGIRKDIPAVPAPIEETFPQWYILKESEVHQALTPWAIKRTGEETSIRYAYDGGDKLLASNETWYGATDVWRQCHSAEAFQRLGILGEAYLPAVPADKRRVPIKAWVTYRLADEGGDWPVRATPADQTYQNWKEIKFDSNGMFIEVDQ